MPTNAIKDKSTNQDTVAIAQPALLARLVMLIMALGGSQTLWATPPSLADKLVAVRTAIHSHQTLNQFKKDFILKELIPVISNPVLVSEIMVQNSMGITLKDIMAIDKLWIDAEDEMPIHREKIANRCAQELDQISQRDSRFVELFVMDNQGALVCMNNITSDYWQGDEAKWLNTFNKGKGGVDIGRVKFDKSAYAKLQQISLPIINNAGSVVGAITFGLNVDKLR